jgi:hypothetical protein
VKHEKKAHNSECGVVKKTILGNNRTHHGTIHFRVRDYNKVIMKVGSLVDRRTFVSVFAFFGE